MLVHHHDPECHARRLGSYLQGQGHSASWNPSNKLFSYLLHFWTLCNQIWYHGHDGASSRAGVLCANFGFLFSRLRSPKRFKSSGYICPDAMFWTTEPFLMTFGLLVYHHDLESHVKSLGSYLQGQGHSVGSILQTITSWSCEPFASKLGIVMHHHEPECYVTILYFCPRGQYHSEGSNLQGMFVLTISSEPTNIL